MVSNATPEKDTIPQSFLLLKLYYSFHSVLLVVVGISARQEVTVVDSVLRLALCHVCCG